MNRFITYTLSVILSAISTSSLFAQNMLPNGGFEEITKKVKESGGIDFALGWSSPTDNKADLFTTECKNPEFAAPANIFGTEKPEDGGNYAGLIMYSLKDAVPRTYITYEMPKPLEAGKSYCVRFFVNLADLSKFSCNNQGLYLSNEKPLQKDILAGNVNPQITHSKKRVFDFQYSWEPICQVYKANGGEKFITIGNFAKYADIVAVKVKRPTGFSKPQVPFAYYYVESVSVTPLDTKKDDCMCEKSDPVAATNVVYSQNISDDIKVKDVKMVELKRLSYEENKFELDAKGKLDLDEVAGLLSKHPEFKLEIEGHTNNTEHEKGDKTLSDKRISAVKAYLVSKGIEEARLTASPKQNTAPENKESTPAALAQNRRVSFKITK